MPNEFQNLQSAVVERLKGDEQLSQLETIAEDRMDLESAIQTALAQLGACMVVGTVEAGVSNPNIPGPRFDSVKMAVSVVENVTLNRSPGSTQLDALSIAITVHKRLHQWRPDGTVFAGYTMLSADRAIVYQQSDEVLAYDCNFTLGNP